MEQRKFDVFDQMVNDDLVKHGGNRKETFYSVNDDMAKRQGYKPYKSYESYKSMRSKYKKRG